MRLLISMVCLTTIIWAKLIPTAFFMNFQRVGRDSTLTHFNKKLFYDCYGIALTKPRGTNSTLMVVSDPDWCRLIYTRVYEQSQDFEYLRQFGGYGTASNKFIIPKGLCIDTTIYSSDSNYYGIYVADSRNNRVSKLKYSIAQDQIFEDSILVSDFNNPADVACVSKSGGGAYIVIAEMDTHRIDLYQRSATGVVSLIQTYGTRGSGTGEFFQPQGVAICEATDATGGYFIYVTDTGNRRIVCLRYKPIEGITWKTAYRTVENAHFLSVTASQYYCVYVTDFIQNKVWVFTPGLDELLYTYGNANLLNGPKDICIDWDRIGLTEKWTATTGIQYFKIEPEVREIYPLSDTFDATIDSVRFNYKVCETSGYLTMKIEGQTIFQNQYHTPGTDTSPYWDGRDGSGKVVVPDNHYIYFNSPNHIAGSGIIDVKGTKIEDKVTALGWTVAGSPYVLAGYSYVDENDTLTIDTSVVVMGRDESSNLDVHGAISAIGNENDSILFTAHRKLLPVEDSTYPGMWGGVAIPSRNPSSKMFFNRIEYANIPVNLNDDTVKVNCIEHCLMKNNNVASQCNFWSAGGFGAGNEYVDNITNKIFVYPIYYEYWGRILDTLHMEKQPVPFYFPPDPYKRKDRSQWYMVYGDADTAATLHIDPGTVLEFSTGKFILIGYDSWYYRRARLVCEGTENDSIRITTPADTIFGHGIVFNDSSNIADTSIVTYTLIENMSADYPAFELGDSTTIGFSNCKFFNCKSYAIEMKGTDPYNNKWIENCSFIQDSIPIISSFSNVNAIAQCNFEDNTHDIIEVLADTVHKDMTIHKLDVPYVFRSDSGIGFNFELHGLDTIVSLTIEAGTEILCDSCVGIVIGDSATGMRGKLMAQGSATDLIHFRALEQPYLWSGLKLLAYEPIDTSHLEHCYISHADSVGLGIYNNSPIIRNTAITNCYEGMRINGTSSQPVIDSSTITLNWCGIHNALTGSTNLNISNNEIYGNKIAIVNEVTSNDVNADSNWWGDASGPWDPTDSISGPPDCNRYGRGDSIGDYVMYRPWLTSPMQTQAVTIIQPNGGNSLFCEGNYDIKWSRTTTPLKQELFYTLDFPQGSLSDEAFWLFVDTVTASESSYVWSVPNTPSNRFRVAVKSFYASGKSSYDRSNHKAEDGKLKRTGNPGISDGLLATTLVAIDISDSNSSIVDTISPQIVLFKPNGGEYFIPSVEDTIKWQASDNHKLGYFDIYMSTDNGENYDLIEEYVDASCSTYCLTPWEANSYRCKAKVVAHDSSDNCKDDVSDSVFAMPIKSIISEMTAYNNACRLQRIFNQKLHLVYSHKTGQYGMAKNTSDEQNDNNADLSRDHLTKDNEIDGGGGPSTVEKVYYIKSTNNGGNWFDRTLMGEGIYPSMAMNGDASKIGVAWTKLTQTKVLYNYYSSETWSGVQTLLDSVTNVTYAPVAVQYASDSIHLVTVRNTIVDEDELVQDVLYLKFPYDDPYSVFMDTVDHWRICGDDTLPKFVSLAVDNNIIPYAVWERPPGDTMFNAPLPAFDIYYARCLKAAWSKENISNTDDNSINPSIEYYGGHVYVVWQEKIDGYCIFLFKRNYTQYPPATETDTISQTSGNAMYPVTKKGGIILWSAGDTSEIYGRIWDSREEEWLDIENWSNTEKSSRYPLVDAWQNEGGTDIMAGWTEDSSVCGYGKKFVSFFPSKGNEFIAFPSYSLKLGDAMSTPFTRYRNGVEIHGNRKFDVGADSLVYHLPYIDKHAICKVYFELYRPNLKGQSADNSKWKIRLDVDDIMQHNLQLLPGEFKTVELTVPASVNSDGKATIRFKKIDGEYILVRRILFYEFERNEGIALMQYADGCQGGETQFTSPVLLSTLYPNPVKGNLIMRVQSPVEQRMKIVLYDITGRIVTDIFKGKVTRGTSEIQMLTDKLAAGVYFIRIETEKTKEIEKVIIIK